MTYDVIRHYDLLIEDDNDPFRDPPPLREYMDKWDGEAFVQALGLTGSENVLEIGVGTGRIAAKVAPLCGQLVGVDISPKTIERAVENLSAYRNVSLICADILSYKSEQTFDVVYSSLTFMHFENKQAALERAAAMLKNDGCFVLSISKDTSEYIDMGDYKLKVYPDMPEEIISSAESIVGLCLISRFETEFAHILVFSKTH